MWQHPLIKYLFLAGAIAACTKDETRKEPQGAPPPPPPTASGATKTNVCAGGGGEVKDPASQAFFARTAGGFCIDPEGEVQTFGDKAKLDLGAVCTNAFDGECEVYKRFGLRRVVGLRYVDGSGSPASVEVYLSQFQDAAGAYGMFTKRVVADADPLAASTKPLTGDFTAAIGKSNAYLCRGPYLLELTYVTEDTKVTADQIAKASTGATTAIAKAIGEKLPGENSPAVVKLLPSANLIPLGVSFLPKDAFGLSGLGQVAVGYYKEGEKRYRLVAIQRDDAEQAKEAMKALRKPGSVPVKEAGEEGLLVTLQEGSDKAKVDYLFARKGGTLFGIADEEFVAKDEKGKLSKEEKLAKLKVLVSEKSKK